MARVTVRHVPLYTRTQKRRFLAVTAFVLAGSLALARNHSRDCSL